MVRRRAANFADEAPRWMLTFDEHAWPGESWSQRWCAWREALRASPDPFLQRPGARLRVMASAYAIRNERRASTWGLRSEHLADPRRDGDAAHDGGNNEQAGSVRASEPFHSLDSGQ